MQPQMYAQPYGMVQPQPMGVQAQMPYQYQPAYMQPQMPAPVYATAHPWEQPAAQPGAEPGLKRQKTVQAVKPVDEDQKEKVDELIESTVLKRNYASCGICMEEKFIQNVIIPCGHNGYCIDCLTALVNAGNATCPVCRNPVANVIKVFDNVMAD